MGKEEIGFPARIGKEGKITIPVEIRRLYGLKDGDTVYLTGIRKLEPGEGDPRARDSPREVGG